MNESVWIIEYRRREDGPKAAWDFDRGWFYESPEQAETTITFRVNLMSKFEWRTVEYIRK